MDVKLFEVRDRMTLMPVMAIRLEPRDERERWLLATSGYGQDAETQRGYVIAFRIAGGSSIATCDPFGHETTARTLSTFHRWVIEHWNEVVSGAVIDVEFILGETTAPKQSEAGL